MFHQSMAVSSQVRRLKAKRAPMPKRRKNLLNMEMLESRCLLSAVLGTASTFAVLADSTVTNTGPTVLNGNLGVSPGTAITGFPPGLVTAPGQKYAADAVSAKAELDANTAYNTLAAIPSTQNLSGKNLGGMTLLPGVYTFSSSAQLTGTLTLNAQNNPNAMFVFQIGSTLTTASASTVKIINEPASFDNVFWNVGSSATLGTNSVFDGTIIAKASITLNTGAKITEGNALALTGAVTLDDDEISPDQDGSISGTKFVDTNGNGVKDTGEPALAGITMFLDLNGDDKLDAGDPTAVTAANGSYLFSMVVPGKYTVREVVPTGWVQTTANPAAVVVPGRTNVSGGNFGDFKLGQISGIEFNDQNDNGVQNTGETGIAGITVFLDTNRDGILDGREVSTVTGANGTYTFTGVGPGNYSVREVEPAGWEQTTLNPNSIAMTSGAAGTGINFGNIPATAAGTQITGSEYQDTNGDGIRQTGETGIAGAVVFLDINHNGILDAGEPTTVTNASGEYVFNGVAPGSYVVREVVPSGWIQTTPSPAAIVITAGEKGTTVAGGTFGDFKLAQISGTEFNDLNGNAVQNAGEPGTPGVTVFLDTNRDGILDDGERSTVTNAHGIYTFTGLTPGTYSVREVVPAGWEQTTPNPKLITVTSGATDSGVNFGNFHFVQILGTASTFAVLADTTVTNTGPTVLNGNLGVSPGTAVTGFPPGLVTAPGQTYAADAVAAKAELDANTAYNTLAALPSTENLSGKNLGGLTLLPGVYAFSSSAQLTGTLTLNAQNNPNAMFVFRIGSTITTASASDVKIINEPGSGNVFWDVGSSATLGTTSVFDGSIIAKASITFNTGASITEGNALALTGAVTLDDNEISTD